MVKSIETNILIIILLLAFILSSLLPVVYQASYDMGANTAKKEISQKIKSIESND